MKNNRWFIWTIVFLVVAGVGLVAYINYVGITDSVQAVPSFVVHQAKPVPAKNGTPTSKAAVKK
jgi:hypothetical protein